MELFFNSIVELDLADATGYQISQLSQEYRSRIASEFDKGLTKAQAYNEQISTFTAQGYSVEEAVALTAFRDAYNDQEDLTLVTLRLQELGIAVPKPENEVWSFCFAGKTHISMADGRMH